jgi:plasmid maintenance system antidote protein VapI
MSPREFRLVLKIAGFTHEEFAYHIHRSRSHVGNLANGTSPLTLRIIDQLRYFLGAEMFVQALALARQSITEEERRRLEREQAARRALAEREAEAEAARERRRQKAALARVDRSAPFK